MNIEIAIILLMAFCLLAGYLVGFQHGRVFTEKTQDKRLKMLRKTPLDKLYLRGFKKI